MRRLVSYLAVFATIAVPFGAAHGQFTNVINSPPTVLGDNEEIPSNTQLNLLEGGSVGISLSVGSADGSSENIEFNISGGQVGNRMEVFHGSTVTISGGDVGPFMDANRGSTIQLLGGRVGTDFDAFRGSVFNVSGGILGDGFEAGVGSTIRLSGGSVGDRFTSRSGSQLTIRGGEFRLDGSPVSELGRFNIPIGATFSGSLADGNPFAFSISDNDSIAAGSLTLTTAELPPVGVPSITASVDPVPQGIREGQVLTVDDGGSVGDHFGAGWGSHVRVELGGIVGANLESVGSTVEIFGGSIGRDFDAFNGSVVSLAGGSVGEGLDAHDGGSVTITGGTVGGNFAARNGSTVSFSGGLIGQGFAAFEGSSVSIVGGDFRIDGVPVDADGIVNVPDGASLSGTFADGNSFAFSSGDGDTFADGSLTLQHTDLPAVNTFLIVASKDAVPQSIREGQSLNVENGGSVGDHFVAGWGSHVRIGSEGELGDNFEVTGAIVTMSGGSIGNEMDAFAGSDVTISGGTVGDGFDAEKGTVVNVWGGSVGDNLSATGSNVAITGGTVGDHFDAHNESMVMISGGSVGEFLDALGGSIVTISGGSIGQRFDAEDGSAVTITGGSVGDRLNAKAGSRVTISGGTVGSRFEAISGSVVEISGGAVGDRLQTFSGSDVTIAGGEFRLDGDLIETLGPITVPAGATLTGTLADGSPFAFASDDGDSFADGTLTLRVADLPPIGPALITASIDDVPLGIREGQTLVVDDGGRLGNHFGAGRDSTVNIEQGGTVGSNLEVVGANVTLLGGSVGRDFDAFTGSTVTISGGAIDDGFDAHNGSIVKISGGSVGSRFQANRGSAVTISGGRIGDDFDAHQGSEVTLVGGEFRLDGELVATGAVNVPNGSSLTGTLADGRPFAFTSGDRDEFADGTLTLQESNLPPIGPSLITASEGQIPSGIRSGQRLIVDNGGAVGDHFAMGWGATARVELGGTMGDNLEAVGSVVTLVGGSIGDDFDAVSRSDVTLTSGSIGEGFDASNRTAVTIVDGTVGAGFRANSGSSVSLEGGSVGSQFEVNSGSSLTIINGEVGDEATATDGSTVTIEGGTIGQHFVANSGSTVNIKGGTVGDGFDSLNGSTVTIAGGMVGTQFDAFNKSTVTIVGGSVGSGFDANNGSRVTITGGAIGDDFDAFSGSVVTISGGTWGEGFDANSGSTVELHGIDFSLDGVPVEGLDRAGDTSIVSQRGGQVLSVTFRDNSVAEFTLNGTRTFDDFFSEGALLQLSLVADSPACDFDGDDLCTVGDIDALVHEILAGTEIIAGTDGATFDVNADGAVDGHDLGEWLSDAARKNGFDEPYLLGDANLDGTVDAADLNGLALNWNENVSQWSRGDFTVDGKADAADLNVLGLNWQNSIEAARASAVPEPGAAVLVLLVVGVSMLHRRPTRRG